MSRINGEKARAAIARKRRSAQRLSDRVLRARFLESRAAALKEDTKKPVKSKKKRVKPVAAETAAPPAKKAVVPSEAQETPKPKARKKKPAAEPEA